MSAAAHGSRRRTAVLLAGYLIVTAAATVVQAGLLSASWGDDAGSWRIATSVASNVEGARP